MIRRIASIAFLLLSAAAAQAACTGADLRTKVSAEYLQQARAEAARIPFSSGNHWVATKGNRTIHVVGTLHVADGRMNPVMGKLKPYIKKADKVFLEVDLKALENAPSLFDYDPALFALPKGRSLKTMLSPEAWQTAFRLMSLTGIDADLGAHLQPWVLSDNLIGSSCRGQHSFSRKGLDYRIAAAAKRARVPLAGLEDIGTGYRAMARQPLRDQAKLLELELRSVYDMDDRMVTIYETYFDEEVALEEILAQRLMYSDLNVSRREVARLIRQYDAQMLDWRNRLWMPKILNSKEKTLFVAVGAAHLPGKQGVLNLLEARGFKLQRAEF